MVLKNPKVKKFNRGRKTSLLFKKKGLHKEILRWRNLSSHFSLFRSLWVQQLINSFIQDGKKTKATDIILNVLVRLKLHFGINPLISLFECLELSRFPIKVSRRKRGRQVSTWLQVIPWWKQYTSTLLSLRNVTQNREASTTAGNYLVDELINIKEYPGKSGLIKKKLALSQLAVEARLQGHYRWRR